MQTFSKQNNKMLSLLALVKQFVNIKTAESRSLAGKRIRLMVV